jgi:thymidylate synthase
MKTYLDALQEVLENGEVREDRTGVGTISLFGMQQRYDLRKGFPAVTTKKLAWKSIVSELLWFIEGSGDERRLAEILHGKRDGVTTIWTSNALAPDWKPQAAYDGDLGRVYGVQWRSWESYKKNVFGLPIEEIDQFADLIKGIKDNPYSRRHILNAWNVADLDEMALPPCHVMAQFYVTKNDELSCQMYQRSCDMFLGVPFNIASYSLLTHLIAHECGLKVGEFVHTLGDAHIYTNHVNQVKQQLKRPALPLSTLWLNPEKKYVDHFTMDDIRLDNYESHGTIKAEMAV